MEVCYTIVTLGDDVLKSPFLSCFFRYKFIRVPSSAFKMSVINKAEMPCLSHFFCFNMKTENIRFKKSVKMFTLFYTSGFSNKSSIIHPNTLESL